ncbi:MAG: hypothetical protein V3W19_00640, partial [Desulfatiglandales bacterium]
LARLGAIVGREAFLLLTSPFYFSKEYHWLKRRTLLLQLCGGDIDESVIEVSDPRLAELMQSLRQKGQSIEDYQGGIREKQRELNKKIDRIPVQVAEAERGRPDISELDSRAFLDQALAKNSEYISKLQTDKATFEAGGGIAEKKKELAEVGEEIAILDWDTADTVAAIAKGKREELDGLCAERLHFSSASRMQSTEVDGLLDEIIVTDKDLELLGNEFERVDQRLADEFLTCNYCSQCIPTGLQEKARVAQLKALNVEGKVLKTKLSELGEALAAKRKEAEESAALAAVKGEEIAILEDEIKRILFPSSPTSDRYKLSQKKAEIQKALVFLAEGNTEVVASVEEKIIAAAMEQKTVTDHLNALDRSAETDARIKELGLEQKSLAREFEKWSSQLSVADLYTRKRVALLQSKKEAIDSRFELARFKMFEVQGNGITKDCCDVTDISGVPFDTNLNGGACVQVGCDIIRTLSPHLLPDGETLPLFIDERQSVTDLPDMDCQVISLAVSDDIEVEITCEELWPWGLKGAKVWMSPGHAAFLAGFGNVSIVPADPDAKTLRVELEKEELAHANQ